MLDKALSMAYVAGFLDGDGCIAISRFEATEISEKVFSELWYGRNNLSLEEVLEHGKEGFEYRLDVSFSNTDISGIQNLKETTEKCLGIIAAITERTFLDRLNNKKVYQLNYVNGGAEILVRALLPYLKIKRKNGELALEFMNIIDDEEKCRKCCERMSMLNTFTNKIKVPGPNESSEIEKAWTAGFFDAEGCVSVWYDRLHATITNTNYYVLSSMQSTFGGEMHETERTASRRPAFRLRFFDGSSKGFLKLIIPYLVIKKERAIAALDYPILLKNAVDELLREKIKREIYAANRRGIVKSF